MAKKNNGAKSAAQAAQAAPQTETKKTVETPVETPATQILGSEGGKKTAGLSQDSKVAYATLLHDRYIKNPQEDAKYTGEFLNGVNMIIDATVLDIAVGEVANGGSPMALILRRNEQTYGAFSAMAASMGVTLPAYSALPQPSSEQLKQAGIVGLLPSETVVATIESKNIAKEVKTAKKEEKKVLNKKPLNPADIKTPEELKESLTRCLLGVENPITRIEKAIGFYTSYISIQNKDNQAELDKIKAMTHAERLQAVVDIVDKCPFALSSIAHFCTNSILETQSPISAFCLYKNAIKGAKLPERSEQELADDIRILVTWSCKNKIAEVKTFIESSNETIKVLEKSKKKNAQAIATESENILNYEAKVKDYEDVIGIVNGPNFSIADNLETYYNSKDEDAGNYKRSHRMVSNILKSYYPELKLEDLDKDSMLACMKAHIGTILNLFCNSLEQNAAYTGVEIPEIKKASAEPVETKEEEVEEKK